MSKREEMCSGEEEGPQCSRSYDKVLRSHTRAKTLSGKERLIVRVKKRAKESEWVGGSGEGEGEECPSQEGYLRGECASESRGLEESASAQLSANKRSDCCEQAGLGGPSGTQSRARKRRRAASVAQFTSTGRRRGGRRRELPSHSHSSTSTQRESGWERECNSPRSHTTTLATDFESESKNRENGGQANGVMLGSGSIGESKAPDPWRPERQTLSPKPAPTSQQTVETSRRHSSPTTTNRTQTSWTEVEKRREEKCVSPAITPTSPLPPKREDEAEEEEETSMLQVDNLPLEDKKQSNIHYLSREKNKSNPIHPHTPPPSKTKRKGTGGIELDDSCGEGFCPQISTPSTSNVTSCLPKALKRGRGAQVMSVKSVNVSGKEERILPAAARKKVSIPAPMILMDNLPYMGELTFDTRPRRGRKPKKADICHLISKNYGIQFPVSYLNLLDSGGSASSTPPIPSTKRVEGAPKTQKGRSAESVCGLGRSSSVSLAPSFSNKDVSIVPIISSNWPPRAQAKPLSLTQQLILRATQTPPGGCPQAISMFPLPPRKEQEVEVEEEEKGEESPLNLCMRDGTQHTKFPSKRKASPLQKEMKWEGQASFERAKVKGKSEGVEESVFSDQSGAFSQSSSLVREPSHLHMRHRIETNKGQQDIPPLPFQKRQVSKRKKEFSLRGDVSISACKPQPMPNVSGHPTYSSFGGSLFGQSTGINDGAEVSICKFKFTGGAKPCLQEKKMLSVDSGGNFRFYTDKAGGSAVGKGSGKGTQPPSFSPQWAGSSSAAAEPTHSRPDGDQLLPLSSLPKSAKSMSMCMSFKGGASNSGLSGGRATTSQESPALPLSLSISPSEDLQHLHLGLTSPLESEAGLLGGDSSCSSSNSGSSSENSNEHSLEMAEALGDGEGRSKPRLPSRLSQLGGAAKRRRRTRKSLMREKLEKTFKEKGFLIQTQQLESAEGATYCKFRQLRKFTRYLFRSWKDYLPDHVKEISEKTNNGEQAIQIPSNAEGTAPPTQDEIEELSTSGRESEESQEEEEVEQGLISYKREGSWKGCVSSPLVLNEASRQVRSEPHFAPPLQSSSTRENKEGNEDDAPLSP